MMNKNIKKIAKKKLELKSSFNFNETNTFNITSELQFNHIIENIKEVYWQCDNKLQFDFLSPSVKSLTGYSEDELKHKTIFDLVTAKSRNVLEKYTQINNSLDQKGIKRTKRNYIVEFIKKDKEKILLDLSIIPIFDKEGKLQSFHGVASDITPQILYNEQKNELREQIKNIINVMPFSITLYDLKSKKIIHANQAFANMLRINLNNAIGMQVTDYIISGLNKRLLKEIITKKKIEQEEILMRKTNGEPFWVIINCSLLKFEKDNLVLVGLVEINNERTDLYNNQKMFAELTNSITSFTNEKSGDIVKVNTIKYAEKSLLESLKSCEEIISKFESNYDSKLNNNITMLENINSVFNSIISKMKKINTRIEKNITKIKKN